MSPIVEASKIYKPLEYLSNIIIRPMDEVMCVAIGFIVFFSCIPVPWIRSPTARKIYATLLGILTTFYAYGAAFWIYIAYVMFAWLL